MKRLALLAFLTVFLACSACATPVQSRLVSLSSNADFVSLAYTSNISSNSLLIIACAALQQEIADPTSPAITDTLANTYSIAVNQAGGGPGNPTRIYIAYTISGSSGANTVTCNPPGTNDLMALVITEYTGMALVSPLDKTASQDNTGTTFTSLATATTAQPNELVFGAMTQDTGVAGITEQSPCTLIREEEDWNNFQPIAVCDYVVSSIGTYSASWVLSVSSNGPAAVATFKIATVAPSARGSKPSIFQ